VLALHLSSREMIPMLRGCNNMSSLEMRLDPHLTQEQLLRPELPSEMVDSEGQCWRLHCEQSPAARDIADELRTLYVFFCFTNTMFLTRLFS